MIDKSKRRSDMSIEKLCVLFPFVIREYFQFAKNGL